jgi:hypothetical protein
MLSAGEKLNSLLALSNGTRHLPQRWGWPRRFFWGLAMTSLLGRHAIVVGAGIGGLTAAKALSSYFGNVTVLERDALPAAPIVRTGTPQARQIHVLLRGGLDALAAFFPDLEAELEREGAVRVRVGSESLLEIPGFDPFPQRDLGFDYLCLTRPLVEFVLRRSVERQCNVVLNARCRVTQFLESPERVAVSGVRYHEADGQTKELAADFIVDASSRGALTIEMLDRMGLPRPQETEIGIDLRYATALFEIPPSAPREWRAVLHRPGAQSGRGGLLVPVENNCWQVIRPTCTVNPCQKALQTLSLLPGRCERRLSTMRSGTLYLSVQFTGSAFLGAYGDTLRDLTAFQTFCCHSAM